VNRLVRDITVTGATVALSAGALVLSTRLLAGGLGPADFGVYSALKRAIGIVVPFSTLTMGVALARFTAMAPDAGPRVELLVSASILGGVPTAVVTLVVFSHPDFIGRLLFARPGYAREVIAAGVVLWGALVYTVLYAYYRGSGQVGSANALLLVNDCLGPVVIAAVLARPGNAGAVLLAMGALNGLALIPLARLLLPGLQVRRWLHRVRDSMGDLFRYGGSRVPGGVTLAAILGAAPLVAAYSGAVADAGYLVAGQAVFAVGDVAFAAFGLVLLPKAAQLKAAGANQALRELVDDLMALALYVGVFGTVHLWIWGDYLLRVWLGEEFGPSIVLFRIFALALVPYVLYGVFRSIVDAVDPRAINVRHLYLGLAVTGGGCLILSGLGSPGLAAGTALGLAALGLATVGYLWSGGWLGLREVDVRALVTLNVVCGAGAVAVRYGVEPLGLGVGAGVGMVAELVLFGLYCAALRRMKVRGIVQFGSRAVTAA
jgi:O-antigen/teichoic acid export membrane protein